MIPEKEINELICALMNTPEHLEMQKAAKKIFCDTVLYRRMLEFEKEQNVILNSYTDRKSVSECLENLRIEYQDLFAHENIKNFIDAAHLYQQIIEECFRMLEKTFTI